jgi:hypothetical protein
MPGRPQMLPQCRGGDRGVEGLIIETRNWGKTVAFWQALGHRVEFETGRNSGRLEHPAGGPYLFVVERPAGPDPEIQPLVGTSSADSFQPPRAGTVEHPFTSRAWGAAEMLMRDPDGRPVSIQAPLPAAAGEPAAGRHQARGARRLEPVLDRVLRPRRGRRAAAALGRQVPQ